MERDGGRRGAPAVLPGYTLVVCEKPDAAKRIAEALNDSNDKFKTVDVEGVPVFQARNAGEEYIVCAAIGHLYAISDAFKGREVYPVYDLEWFPAYMLDESYARTENRIRAIQKLASGAASFVNACDFDVEGDTIGYNILKYACGGKQDVSLRAKFSVLTKEELVRAFHEARVGLSEGLATAGRIRHALDFIWGANLSRALTESVRSQSRYRMISMGRVQGPTLSFVVDREIEIRTFVPIPHWIVTGLFEKDGTRFEALHSPAKILKKAEADRIVKSCEGQAATVAELSKSVYNEHPAPPFNIGDLQKEAYRVFGYTPSRTLQTAQRLYLDALISYPRTGSQKIPSSIRYRDIITNLGRIQDYGYLVSEILGRELKPRDGDKRDPAHPAIYPTGENPKRLLTAQEKKIFDLVVRRFLACFAEDAIRERLSALILVDDNEFRISGRRTIKSGWTRYYRYSVMEDKQIPSLREGDKLTVVKVKGEEKLEGHPARYNQSSLLERMEKEGIGTKATRAEIISTLISRGYVSGESLVATDLGLAVIETMRRFCSQIVSTELTSDAERELEEVEAGTKDGRSIVEEVVNLLSEQIAAIKANEDDIGRELKESAYEASLAQTILGDCPICKTGKLRIIRSLKTRKRFVGCTNYSTNGCRASAPLPQRGTIKITGKSCSHCGWPVVYARLGKFPWRLCVNPNCVTKGDNKKKYNEVQTLQKKRRG